MALIVPPLHTDTMQVQAPVMAPLTMTTPLPPRTPMLAVTICDNIVTAYDGG